MLKALSMAKRSDKLVEFEIERNRISTFLEALKRAVKKGDIAEEDFSEEEYRTKLEEMDRSIREIEGEMGEASVEEVPIEGVEVQRKLKLRIVIDPGILEKVEAMKAEMPSVEFDLSELDVKKQAIGSSLDIIKKIHDEGVMNDEIFNKLQEKYEKDISLITREVEDTRTKIEKTNDITSKYNDLLAFQDEYEKKINSVEIEILDKEKRLKFIEARRLYLVSNIKGFFSGLLESLEKLEENARASGVPYPDEPFIEEYEKKIWEERQNSSDIQNKVSNIDGLIESLERDREKGEVEERAYSLLRTGYDKEKANLMKNMGRMEGKLMAMEKDLKSYKKLPESLEANKALLERTHDYLRSMWSDEEIESMNRAIEEKRREARTLEEEMTVKLEELEGELKGLFQTA